MVSNGTSLNFVNKEGDVIGTLWVNDQVEALSKIPKKDLTWAILYFVKVFGSIPTV